MQTKEYKISNILFINGVFIKDCIPNDDIFEQQIIDQLKTESPVDIYNKIPSIFTNNETWIKKTNLKCWYCDLTFANIPVFIPKLIEPINTGYNICTHGSFCSFCCALAYNNTHNTRICENIRVKEMLLFLYKIFTGSAVSEICESPSKYLMQQYGGDLDPMTYRNNVQELKKNMKLLEFKQFD
jgi:hypothetical protein